VLICGDAGGMVNVPELKGIHYAMHAGILAAEHIVEALKGDCTDLRPYDHAVRESLIGRDLHRTRNMRQPFGRGFFIGGAVANAMVATGGRLPGGHWKTQSDAEVEVFDGGRSAVYPKPDGRYTFDKLSSVFISGNSTRDDAPDHIRIQRRVPRELAEMWQWMCPACVYEVPEDAPADGEVDPDRQLHQLRAVRGDQRQGRTPDTARGRRRAPIPQHLTGAARPPTRQASVATMCPSGLSRRRSCDHEEPTIVRDQGVRWQWGQMLVERPATRIRSIGVPQTGQGWPSRRNTRACSR